MKYPPRCKHGWMSSCLEGCEDAYKPNRRLMMFHADYFEPKAQMVRVFEREHMAHRCDGCGKHQVCPQALPIDDDYKECRFAGCQGGTLMEDCRILCGMCH